MWPLFFLLSKDLASKKARVKKVLWNRPQEATWVGFSLTSKKGWKGMLVTNILAFETHSWITVVKRFITSARQIMKLCQRLAKTFSEMKNFREFSRETKKTLTFLIFLSQIKNFFSLRLKVSIMRELTEQFSIVQLLIFLKMGVKYFTLHCSFFTLSAKMKEIFFCRQFFSRTELFSILILAWKGEN